MSAPSPREPDELPPYEGSMYGESMDALSELDRSRLAYFDACAEFHEKPTEKNREAMLASMHIYGPAFDELVNSLPGEGSFEDYSTALGNLHLHQDNMRVDYLNALLGHELLESSTFAPVDEDSDENDTPFYQAPEAKENIAAEIIEFFRSGLVVDTKLFEQHIRKSNPENPVETRSTVAKHALDVGKIALGTFLGIWAARRTWQHKQ